MYSLPETGTSTSRRRDQVLEFLKSKGLLYGVAIALLLVLALYHLSAYPVTWFDEGSHLHVPKTLLRFGEYADYSSEGFRYYGPTVGVGPTVFLPIAFVFRVAGMGLLQARLVIALYFLAAVGVYYGLARYYGGAALAGVATALAVTSRGVNFWYYGRQVLGEVPGFFFMLAGLWVWIYAWERPTWKRLVSAGLLLGLSLVTKNQYLIVLGPGLVLVFLLNLVYYKAVPQRVFLITGVVTVLVYAVWQVFLVFKLGPATASQNWALFRQATAESALIFSPALMKQSLFNLLDAKMFLGFLLPAWAYGGFLSLPRNRKGLLWSVLFLLSLVNLVWYVFASIGWIRYLFPALAFAGIFVARLFFDLTDGFQLKIQDMWRSLRQGEGVSASQAGRGILIGWLALMILVPLAQDLYQIARPPFNAPASMAAYMNARVDRQALVETWEPEMGFLTDHNYHYPPPDLLYTANSYIWLGKTAPSTQYDFVQKNLPDYVLVGAFSTWVQLYPPDVLARYYHLETTIGAYQLYARY